MVISDGSTKHLGIKTEYTPRTVVRLDNICSCLIYDGTVNDEWKVTLQDTKMEC